ncbi:hypothetical protein ACWD25_42760, partial [Streptomyces sp. NPDC002920]
MASGFTAALLVGALGTVASSAAPAPPPVLLHAAPDGSGSACTLSRPCSVLGAQQRERQVLAGNQGAGRDVVVVLSDGTYRLTAPLRFGPADSGRN